MFPCFFSTLEQQAHVGGTVWEAVPCAERTNNPVGTEFDEMGWQTTDSEVDLKPDCKSGTPGLL